VDHRLIARVGLSLLCAIQGIATVVLDCNRTHATNPTWTPHARFHVVWQTSTTALAAAAELVLLWSGWVGEAQGFYLALMMASLSPIGFLATCVTIGWFGGALSDANGIQPVPLNVGSRIVKVDLNLVAVVAALVTIGAIIFIYKG